MKLTLQEDLQQLQMLGWSYGKWLRKEQNYMARRRSRTGHEIAPEPSVPPSDLQWVMEGGRRTRMLTCADRHTLMLVHNSGFRRSCQIMGLPIKVLRDHLQRIEQTLFTKRNKIANG